MMPHSSLHPSSARLSLLSAPALSPCALLRPPPRALPEASLAAGIPRARLIWALESLRFNNGGLLPRDPDSDGQGGGGGGRGGGNLPGPALVGGPLQVDTGSEAGVLGC